MWRTVSRSALRAEPTRLALYDVVPHQLAPRRRCRPPAGAKPQIPIRASALRCPSPRRATTSPHHSARPAHAESLSRRSCTPDPPAKPPSTPERFPLPPANSPPSAPSPPAARPIPPPGATAATPPVPGSPPSTRQCPLPPSPSHTSSPTRNIHSHPPHLSPHPMASPTETVPPGPGTRPPDSPKRTHRIMSLLASRPSYQTTLENVAFSTRPQYIDTFLLPPRPNAVNILAIPLQAVYSGFTFSPERHDTTVVVDIYFSAGIFRC